MASCLSPLWMEIERRAVETVAVVGVCKHAGKTTVLGRLIDDAARANQRLGLVSVGVDGERADVILGTPKPQIRVPSGTLFATSIQMQSAGAMVQWLEPADISSPVGDVWIGRARSELNVVLAGVRQREHLLRVKALLYAHGAERVLIDGALARMVAVQPDVADAVVLATGAAAGSPDAVRRVTRDTVMRLTAPLADRDVVELMESVTGSGMGNGIVTATRSTGAQGEGNWSRPRYDPELSAFSGDPRRRERAERDVSDGEPQRLWGCLGAVTDALVQSLILSDDPVLLVAQDPSRLFVSLDVWRAFARAGHHIQVVRRAELLGVTINPHSPRGTAMDRCALREMVEGLTSLPVWDVMEW
ncbi:MAG: hypothetical protein OWU32_07925 [Firmicutes bacterium]|nr:hypothetical protein [Bacillota bacterium]